MRNRKLALLLVLVVVLVACVSAGGPPTKKVKEILYKKYLSDTEIIEKTKCEPTAWMKRDGHTNVWLVVYRVKGLGRTAIGMMLLTDADGEWRTYLPRVHGCPD